MRSVASLLFSAAISEHCPDDKEKPDCLLRVSEPPKSQLDKSDRRQDDERTGERPLQHNITARQSATGQQAKTKAPGRNQLAVERGQRKAVRGPQERRNPHQRQSPEDAGLPGGIPGHARLLHEWRLDRLHLASTRSPKKSGRQKAALVASNVISCGSFAVHTGTSWRSNRQRRPRSRGSLTPGSASRSYWK